jgi:hypothetical protein
MTKVDYREVGLKQAYEWIKTGYWYSNNLQQWLKAKGLLVQADSPIYASLGGTMIHRPDSTQVSIWIRNGFYNIKDFKFWMNQNLCM